MKKIIGQTLTVSHVLLALISGIVGSIIAVVPAYWQLSIMNSSLQAQRDQIEIMRQTLEKEAKLVMTVIPSCAITVTGHPNGTVEIENSTLTLSKTKEFYFTMYVSNVGDAFAHLLYYSVILHLDSPTKTHHTISSVYSMETVALKPHESTSFQYTFDPLEIPPEMLGGASHLNFTFMLGAAEMSISTFIHTQF